MDKIEQGDLLRISGINSMVIVASNNLFNATGNVVVCPVVNSAEEGPLHISVSSERYSGVILCEQVHYINLYKRHFQKLGSVDYFSIMDFSDAVMGIFDYLS